MGVGSFLTLGLVALGLIVISRFGPGFGAGAAGIGTGLQTLGGGIRGFISQVASPTISPGFFPRLDVSGVLPGLQDIIGEGAEAVGPGKGGAPDLEDVEDVIDRVYPPDEPYEYVPPPGQVPRDEFDDPIYDESSGTASAGVSVPTAKYKAPAVTTQPAFDYEYDWF